MSSKTLIVSKVKRNVLAAKKWIPTSAISRQNGHFRSTAIGIEVLGPENRTQKYASSSDNSNNKVD